MGTDELGQAGRNCAEEIGHDASRQRLYDVMAADRSLAEKQSAVLDIGRRYLDVSVGFLSRIDRAAGTFDVVACDSELDWIEPGLTADISETYCQRTIERDSPLAVADATDTEWDDHPANNEYGMSCYLGTAVEIEGELFGTLCFVDPGARSPAFTDSERAFVELAAQMIGRERETARRERTIAERERALERSEQKYESLVTTAPDAIFLADVGRREIVEVNDAATEMTGYDRSELVGMDQRAIHPPEHRDDYEENFRRVVAADGSTTRRSDGQTLAIQRADGTAVPVEINANTLELDGRRHVQATIRDISDRRQRQKELRLKNRATEEAGIGITIAEADGDNELVYANEAFAETTGYDRSALLGRNCRLLQGPETDRERVAAIGDALGDSESIRTELLNYRADGTPFWNELSISPVEDEAGDVTHFVGFQRDVTERKRREQLATILNRVLRHNLRNRMSVVIAHAGRLEERLPPEEARVATQIRDAAGALTQLGQRAREIQRIAESSRDPTPRDVVRIVENVADGVRAEYPNATVSIDAPETCSVLGTPALADAIEEVATNAAEHAGSEPTIAVRIERTEQGVAVSVTDDGPGLPEHERRVLERGYETQLDHGSGLGLWFVDWVVTTVGGRIRTTVDDGTTLTMHLIEATPEAEADRVTPARPGCGR